MVQQQQDDTHNHSHPRRLSKDTSTIQSHQRQYQEPSLVLPLPSSSPSRELQGKCGSGPDHPDQWENVTESQHTVDQQQQQQQQEPQQQHQQQEEEEEEKEQQQEQELPSEPQRGSEPAASHENSGTQITTNNSPELVPDHIHMAATPTIPEGIILESSSQVESDNMGVSFKRGSRQMNATNPTVPSTTKNKETPLSPPRKKPRTESAKKSENDTASLFQKIFADRDPGKRKIKTKSVHEISMDLAADEDDSDFDDTKIDSNDDDDEDMVLPEDAPSEDEIQPDQQEAFNDEQDLLTALWQWSCVCCPSKDGAFRRLVPEDPSSGWVHVVCALWLPETTLGDPENVDKISVRDIPEKNWNLTCYMCTDPQDAALGACVQCDAGRCRKSFHITCAQGYSLLETIDDSDMADPYFMYCKQHGSSDGNTKLNGWAKWVKQRDAFLKKWQDEQERKRTQRLIDMQQSVDGDEDGGEGLVEFFEHSYSRFKQAREKRIAKERSELSRQYSIGYYLGNKIDKSRSRLEVISSKARQALLEQRRIEMHTRNLLSSLLECANYLENVSAEQLEAPLSIDTTLAWYNSLPDTSRWKSNIQDIIETIDIESLACDNPYTQPGVHAHLDSGLDDSESGQRHGRSSKDIYGKLSKKGSKASFEVGKNVKSKKVHPKPTLTNKSQIPVVFTSSRGRLIKREFSDPDDCYSSSRPHGEKLALERDVNGMISPMAIKVLNRMVTCDTCHRPFHPKCLDPPMARVPPRGYSWNCEDCDSSEESQGSSDEGSPTIASARHSNRHQHSHSSDLDEALMVLADTAMTYSVSNDDYQSPHGVKRPLVTNGLETNHGDSKYYFTSAVENGSLKGSKVKKIKTEGSDKPTVVRLKAKSGVPDRDADKPKAKKSIKSKDDQLSSDPAFHSIFPNGSAAQSMDQPVAVKPSSVAPIIRGNLRIYPPGPHIAPKISNVLMKEVAVREPSAEAEKPKSKAVSKKVSVSKGASLTKKEPGAGTAKSKIKGEAPTMATGDKTKKAETSLSSIKSKIAATTTAVNKKASAKDSSASATATATAAAAAAAASPVKVIKSVKITTKVTDIAKVIKATEPKEKTGGVHRGALPAVPVAPPSKPKEVIRYSVGEKTVEELTAKEDVEIERRDNVKFRKLRGRTLTMPASSQESLANGTATGAVA
ncbi:PHD finger protein 14 [Modicella reniformis]|uniref:PHD finger protein 14 n=1 Tax=Modicella reniformis TaxID=1440133 RepID=A0A9P6MGY6_9FUNG|nr:PHD finger protein 14 [Modicella reniformis]